jgi:branched-chain amino acid aminotransferase
MEIGYSVDELIAACLQVVRSNGFKECYLRPLVFRGYGSFGVNPLPNPIETYIPCWVWEKYLGQEGIEHGVDVCVASWARLPANTLPTTGQDAANWYELTAHQDGGHHQRIRRRHRPRYAGMVSEGENIFSCVMSIAPPLGSSILPGITRFGD